MKYVLWLLATAVIVFVIAYAAHLIHRRLSRTFARGFFSPKCTVPLSPPIPEPVESIGTALAIQEAKKLNRDMEAARVTREKSAERAKAGGA